MSQFQDIINSEQVVLIDFSAEWCQPCKMMPPILKQVKQQVGDHVRILKVDVDKNPAIAHKWKIQNVPTLMIFKKGEMKFRQAGVIPAPQLIEQVRQFL
ncbi:MAG: thioredoxin [Bacteroidales bacterium]|nr:thioredoxin [Bacteroidales bacterium]